MRLLLQEMALDCEKIEFFVSGFSYSGAFVHVKNCCVQRNGCKQDKYPFLTFIIMLYHRKEELSCGKFWNIVTQLKIFSSTGVTGNQVK